MTVSSASACCNVAIVSKGSIGNLDITKFVYGNGEQNSCIQIQCTYQNLIPARK